MSDFDFSDINLDFLQSTPPRRPQGSGRIDTPTIKSELDIGPSVIGGKRTKSKKVSEWAKKIANTDELIKEIKKLKLEKLELQAQLKDLQKSALTIQNLYTTEKKESDLKSKEIKQLQEKYELADSDLTVKNLQCDQLEGQIAVHKDRPVEYNVLTVKYLRLLNKLDEDEYMRNFTDRLMIENLRQYCVKYKLKAPPAACSKQFKNKRLPKEDAAVQCDLINDMPIVVKPAMKSQSTQCQPEKRNQGSQHISTMTTRGTTTSCFIQYRTVGTSFPDSQPNPVVDEILKEFVPWHNITPISPLIDQPTTSDKSGQSITKAFRSIGTCTWLCNIRRTIDFMPRNPHKRSQNARPSSSCHVSTSQSIKQEVTTPSPSPTPNVPTTDTSNHNINATAPQTIIPAVTPSQNVSNPLIAAMQSSLPLRHFPDASFDSLWHIFGRMLLGLLQTSNAGIATNATTTNNESVNQHQFYSWLRELYESTVTASGTNNPEQIEITQNVATSPISLHTPDSPTMVLGQSETHTVATSPLHFSQTSPFASPNVIRPQPRRSVASELAENLEDPPQEDFVQPYVHTPNTVTSNFNCESTLTSTSDNDSIHDANLTVETPKSFKTPKKPAKKRKKHVILQEIEELFPEAKLSKSKRKTLKRLLKSQKQKKKKCIKDAKVHSPPIHEYCEEETAVDFLNGIFEIQEVRGNVRCKTNSDVKNSFEIVRVENIHNKETETKTNNIEIRKYNNTIDLNIDDSANFKKPKNVNKKLSCAKTKCPKISNKKELYTSLFGDSDTELEDDMAAEEITNDTSYSQMQNCEELDQDLSLPHNISLPDISTPLLKAIEMSLVNEPESNLLFDHIDKETQERLETIIDKQLQELPNIEGDDRAAQQDIPSDFEQDFELSSEDDDKVVSKEFATKDIYTESLQCKTPLHLEQDFDTIASKEEYVMDSASPEDTQCDLEFSCEDDNNIVTETTFLVSKEVSEESLQCQTICNLEKEFNTIDSMEENDVDKAGPEDIPSDFENDFELSSEDDDNVVTESIFLESKEDATKDIYNEILQRKTSYNLEKVFDINVSKEEAAKASYKNNINCNTVQTINSSHTTVDVINSARESKNFMLKEKCNDSIEFEMEKYGHETNDQVNNTTFNSCDSHVNITPKNDDHTEVLRSKISTSPLKVKAGPVFNTPEQSEMSTSTTQSEEEDFSVIEISSDLTSELSVNESPGSNTFETIPNIKCQQNTTAESVSNSEEIANYHIDNVKNSKELHGFYSFPLERNKSKENISGLSLEDKISVVEISGDYTVVDVTSLNKSNNSSIIDEKASLQTTKDLSTENCFVKSPPTSSTKVSVVPLKLNTYEFANGYEVSTYCEEGASESPTDDEISVISISTDNTGIENKCRDITTSPNDELFIDDGTDETYEDNQELKQNTIRQGNDVSKNNTMPKMDQQWRRTTTGINCESDNTNPIDSLNSTTEISSLLNSSLCKDILSDSILPLVDDVLRDDNIMLGLHTPVIEPKVRGRKRKSECLYQTGEQPPCKRSERLRARKNNLSLTPVEIGKYTRANKNNASDLKRVEKLTKNEINNSTDTKEKEVKPDVPVVSMGFFRERNESKAEESSIVNCALTSLQDKRNVEVTMEANNCLEIINSFEKDASSPLSVDGCTEKQTIRGNDESLRNDSHMNASAPEETVKTYKTKSKPTEIIHCNITNATLKQLNVDTSYGKNNALDYSESPLSPPPHEETIEVLLNSATFNIPLELSPQYRPKGQTNNLLENLISHYSPSEFQRIVTAYSQSGDSYTKREMVILADYENTLKDYCCNPMHLDPDIMASRAMGTLQQYSIEYPLLCCAILKLAKNAEPSVVKERELPSIIQEMPPRHLCLSLQRLFYLIKHLTRLHPTICQELLKKVDTTLFNVQQSEKITLNGSLHLIQLYLMSCKLIEHELSQHPARILIAKCLYFHAAKSISMIHEVLMWYPTAMPPKEDRTYDRSDALITVIQQLLMATKYDMDNTDLRGKSLLSKLRFEYHYLPFKPSFDETISNLLEKLKMSKLCNLSLAFSLICKRMLPIRAEILLQTHILPLANEYFNQALKNTEFDERIAVVLEIIAKVVKPFPSDWDVEVYLNLFSRFLSNIDRAVIQESAVCSIIRLQRFGYVNCFHRLISFKPTFELSSTAQAMLKTFIHRRPLCYLNKITNQSRVNSS